MILTSRRIKNGIIPYLFVLPFIISFLLFYLWPIVSAVLMSFQSILPGQVEFVGLENYRRLDDPHFFSALKNSLRYTFWTILLLIPVPMIFAVILNSEKTPGRNIFKSAYFIPSLVSVVVAGTVFRLIFAASDKGLMNSLVQLIGLNPRSWLLDSSSVAMFLLVSTAFWRWFGINIIYFISGLQNIPSALYEAATIDGAGPYKQFVHITVPLLKPITIFVFTISIFGGLAMFEESYIYWQGNSPGDIGLTIVGYLWRMGFQHGELGMGNTIGIVLLLLIVLLNLTALKLFGFFKER